MKSKNKVHSILKPKSEEDIIKDISKAKMTPRCS
jgi:hypothetical protein